MWRYLILSILAVSFVTADDVLLFGSKESILQAGFQLLINENPSFINSQSPANGTVIDRDSVSADPDTIVLNLTVPDYIPDGTLLEFRANLTSPSIAGQNDILLGTNTTIGHSTIIYYNPSSSVYAGNYVWYGNSSASTVSSTASMIVKGGLSPVYASSLNPNSTYFSNDSATIEVNITSGPETMNQLGTLYNLDVNNTAANTSGTTTTTTLIYLNPFWSAVHTLLFLDGIGVWSATTNAEGPYHYNNTVQRTFTVYGYMNVTENTTNPTTVYIYDYTTFTCRIRDQFNGYAVQGANVTFYRNNDYVGSNVTDNLGQTSLDIQGTTYGTSNITCNVTTQLPIYYYQGDAPEGNTIFHIISRPPSFSGVVDDFSNDTNPTNEGSNVTFSANGTDPESDQWYLLICTGAVGVNNGNCDGTEICRSELVNSENIASCQHNSAGEPNEYYSWFGYACDSTGACNTTAENSTAPYKVNHQPTASPTITPAIPDILNNLTCNPNAVDSDTGDTVSSSTYIWYAQNEGSGAYIVLPGQNANQLTSSYFDSNDNIICQVTPVDNHGFPGNATNSTPAMISKGTLSAASNLAKTMVYRTFSTTMNVSCTLTNGDSEAMTLVVQDDRTSSYTQSSTTPAAVYVSQSSFNLGRVVSTTVQKTITVYTQTAGNYNFRAQCQASDTNATLANSTAQTLQVVLDTTPPIISSVQVINIEGTSATVIWTTDLPSDSTVKYGTTLALGSAVYDPSMVTGHNSPIINLQNSTGYYYNVTSCNADNYCSTAGPNTFTTRSPQVMANPIEHGYCTAVVVEPGPNYKSGFISKGDVYEFYCELPEKIKKRETFTFTLTNKNKKITQQMTAPPVVSGNQVVIYP